MSFGERPPDSPAIHKLQAYILGQLKTRGCEVMEDKFNATAPQGPVPMMNIIAKFPGKSGKAIVITGHYDTKTVPKFVGANDGGSSTGFLLEMAEALQGGAAQRRRYLVFFDGEEAYGEWTDTNSLYGSRHLAEKWAGEGMPAQDQGADQRRYDRRQRSWPGVQLRFRGVACRSWCGIRRTGLGLSQ